MERIAPDYLPGWGCLNCTLCGRCEEFTVSAECGLLTAEDARQAADHEELLRCRGDFVRDTTPSEMILAEWLGVPGAKTISDNNPATVKVDSVGVRRRMRRVGGRPWFDPDADTSP